MNWYEDDIKKLEALRGALPYEPEVIFYGSSTIRLWTSLYDDFKPFKPVNLGFGGATLAACVWFFDRVFKPYASPRHIVFYAGDNDLGDGRTAEEVYLFFKQWLVCLNNRFPAVPFSFVSVKPSLARRHLLDRIQYANQLIRKEIETAPTQYYYVDVYSKMLDAKGAPRPELFETDGLHMSKAGYEVWKNVLGEHLNKLVKNK